MTNDKWNFTAPSAREYDIERSGSFVMRRRRGHLSFAILLIAASALLTPARAQDSFEADPADPPYAQRDDAMRFADQIAERRGLAREWTRRVIGQARYLPDIPPLMLPPPPGTAKNWRAYRARFVEPTRIRAGARFWRRNRATLARAQAEYGVPPEIITGIIGVETLYGRHMGRFRVIDALATLAFDFPPEHPRAAARQTYFQGELEQFLLLAQRTRTDPAAPRGSYAGAMGMAQFLPSSWTHHAIDYDGDGHIDLWRSEADAIGSVANYLKNHGWQPALPTHYAVRLTPGITDADLAALLAPDILPSFTPAGLAARGARLDADGPPAPGGLLALIELQNGDPALPGNAPAYVAGTPNFYAITRYNQSAYYAMAVIDLGNAVADAAQRRPAP
jgi:membrane-bound lytic murein transglycosylase B